VWPPELEDEASPAADLTFVNFTDPVQSKSQESRRLVRTQVMRNFAREQKRQKAQGEAHGMAREGSSASVRPHLSAVQNNSDGAIQDAQQSSHTDIL
jgi:hypothetical protein